MRAAFLWALTALTSATVIAAKVSDTGRCGTAHNGLVCTGSSYGNCCSGYGYCGSTADHCGKNCDSAYGSCTGQSKTVSTDGSCGGTKGYTCQGSTFGNCCSQYGYCGSTSAYCSTGCNSGFGTCSNAQSSLTLRTSTRSSSTLATSTRSSSTIRTTTRSSSVATAASPSSSVKVSTNARCGNINGATGGFSCLGSQWGDCCSQYNYCGSTSAYCDTGCQPEFGNCVSSSSSSIRLSTSSTRLSSSSSVGSSSSSSAIIASSSAFSSTFSSSSSQASSIQSTSSSSSAAASSSSIASSSIASTSASSSVVSSSITSSTAPSVASTTVQSSSSPASSTPEVSSSVASSTPEISSSVASSTSISSTSLESSSQIISSTSSDIASSSAAVSVTPIPSSTPTPTPSESCIPTPTNYVTNGGLESGDSTGFTLTSSGNPGISFVSPGYTGNYLARLTATQSTSPSILIFTQSNIAIPAGTTVNIFVNVRSLRSAVTGTKTFRLYFDNALIATVVPTTDNWVQLAANGITVTGNTHTFYLRAYSENYIGAFQEFDDISIIPKGKLKLKMSANLVPLTVIKGAGNEFIPLPQGENATVADFHSIRTQTTDSPSYLTSGFYKIEAGPARLAHYTFEETKYVLSGQIDILDEATGITHHLVPGDFAFFHVGSRVKFATRSKGLAFYAVTRPVRTPHPNLQGREEDVVAKSRL